MTVEILASQGYSKSLWEAMSTRRVGSAERYVDESWATHSLVKKFAIHHDGIEDHGVALGALSPMYGAHPHIANTLIAELASYDRTLRPEGRKN